MSKGGDKQTSVATSEPWKGVQPSLLKLIEQLNGAPAPQFYPNATYTPFAPQQEQALGMMEQRALQGSPLNQLAQNTTARAAMGLNGINTGGFNVPNVSSYGVSAPVQNSLQGTLSGQFVNSNPFLNDTYGLAADNMQKAYLESVVPGVNASFSLGGRTGSGAHQEAIANAGEGLAEQLRGLGNDIFGQDYARERDRMLAASQALGGFDMAGAGLNLNAQQSNQNAALQQMQASMDAQKFNAQQQMAAAGMLPGMANLDYADMERLFGVGATVQGQADKVNQAAQNRYNYYQNLPFDYPAKLFSLYSGSPGGQQSSQTTGGGGSTLGNAIGGGLTGYGLQTALQGGLGSALAGSGVGTAALTTALGGWALPLAGLVAGGLLG